MDKGNDETIPSSAGSCFRRGGCLRELWSSISYPLIPRSFNLGMVMGIWWVFFFSFFFWQLWRLGVPPPQLLLDGGVACVMATCHAGIGWRVLGSSKTFQFPTFFETLPFLNPLCFFCAYFFEISMFIAPSPLASSVLHYCDFCAHPFDSSISLSFVGTSLCLSCSFHLKFCLLLFLC